MLTISSILASDAAWQDLLPPHLMKQQQMRIAQAPAAPQMVVARLFGAPVGGAVAVPLDMRQGELLLLTVVPPLRRKNIGSRLLTAIESAAWQSRLATLTCSWSTPDKADPAALGAFLTARGWQVPSLAGRDCRVQAESTARFLRRITSRLPPAPPHTIISWASTSSAQRVELAARLTRDPVAPALDPFALEALNHPQFSKAMIADDQIRAWFMGRRTAPRQLWIAASYALPEALDAAWSLPLWADVFDTAEAEEPGTIVGWDTPLGQMPMSRFLQRREVASGGHVGSRWNSTRQLPQQAALC